MFIYEKCIKHSRFVIMSNFLHLYLIEIEHHTLKIDRIGLEALMFKQEPLSTIVGQRYQIEDYLGHGGMGTVFRAFDRLTGGWVALKRITSSSEYPGIPSTDGSADTRLSLANEFQVLASLRHPNIIGVLDYGFDTQRQPFFTMELLEQSSTILDLGKGLDISQQVQLLVQTLQALVYLHRRRIIHRDIKPSNVLAQGTTIKVLDFGLSIQRTLDSQEQNITVGTLDYMAPEVFQGEAATEASDLYAVGLIAYQMLAKRHPFNTESITKLVDQIINQIPDPAPLNAPPKLASVVQRLLMKSPRDRYSDADRVIYDLCEAANLAIPTETVEIRESFIQNAQFVGRDVELARLTKTLVELQHHHGRLWLIGGESGVGKSRLINELRTQALVRGVSVLRGQEVSEGGRPYQVWLEILRWLVLGTPIDDLEAGVLKTLIPDIEKLIHRSVSDAPTLDPQAAQDRMRSTIEAIFLRQTEPLLLVLEDLHWAGSDSLDLLKRLNTLLDSHPIMVIASYRDDERPDLPNEFPQAQMFKLERLSDRTIETLLEAMIGTNTPAPHVVKLLQKESEGNIYFLVEAVRVLAQAAGDLSNISHITLPERIVAGGIQQIVQRRLAHVPAEARQLLELAAIVGRSLDLNLLAALEPEGNIENWLTVCANAAVIEVQVGAWRFAHDKLRERLLSEIPQDRRRTLHEKVALAIEKIDPVNAAAALLYHWNIVGNRAKVMFYAGVAGDLALRAGATREAIDYYRQALNLHTEIYPQSATKAHRLQRATWEKNLGRAYFTLGKFREGMVYLQQATAELGAPMPVTSRQVILGLLNQLFRQVLHRLAIIERPYDVDLIHEVMQDFGSLGEAYYFGRQIPETLYCTIREVNLAEVVNARAEQAHGYGGMAVAFSLIPLHNIAQRYARYAYTAGTQVSDPLKRVNYLITIGTYEIGMGNWRQTEKLINEALALGQKLGDQRQLGNAMVISVANLFAQARFEDVLKFGAILQDMAEKNGNIQHLIWALALQYRVMVCYGSSDDLDKAQALAQKVLALSASVPGSEPGHEIDALGAIAFAEAQKGHKAEAIVAIQNALEVFTKAPATQATVIDGLSYLCLACFHLIQHSQESERKNELLPLTKRVMEALPGLYKRFPATRSAVKRMQGLYSELLGNSQQAVQFWTESIDHAQQFEQPYDLAASEYELGRHLVAHGNDSGESYLSSAKHNLQRIGAWRALLPKPV
jgi:serine/threonine protein kinase/tetratricopeptide (TPR) repeat protein